MIIVFRKKIVKRYLLLALAMILLGRILAASPAAEASTMVPVVSIEELKYEGFSNSEIKSMGFVGGISKIILYNIKQQQIWDRRVEQARERVEVAKLKGRKPNPKDQYLLERDEQIKNPPKKPLGEKLFGQFGVHVASYFKSDKSAKIVGNGLTLGGCALFLIKALAPLAI